MLRIEATADRILAETGIIVCDDPATLSLSQAAGERIGGTLMPGQRGGG